MNLDFREMDMPIVRIFQVNGKLEYDGISVKFKCGEQFIQHNKL